jgi:hypothetical protein
MRANFKTNGAASSKQDRFVAKLGETSANILEIHGVPILLDNAPIPPCDGPTSAISKCSNRKTKLIVGSVMSYLSNVVNERPMVRVSASVILAFCCAAPLVWLFSNLVVYGLRSFL